MKVAKLIGCIVLLAMMGCSDTGGGEGTSLKSVFPETQPVSPSSLGATAASFSQINLTWTDNSNNETGFKIERKIGSSGTYVHFATAAANTASYSDTGLTASTAYYYRIRATNSIGDSGFTSEVNATTLANTGGGGTGSGIFKLCKTGQTVCYDADGAAIACVGTGQDGELQIGVAWTNPRFVDNSLTNSADQTVTDKLTGLMWTKDANLMKTRDPAFDTGYAVQNGFMTWQHALDYVKKLNSESYLGHNDWRLPNINELESLANKGQERLDTWLSGQGFTDIQEYYGSSTTWVGDTRYAWGLRMFSGFVTHSDYGDKSSGGFVWPVRSEKSDSLTVLKTGQTTCYDGSGVTISCTGTGQDGELQVGVALPPIRFSINDDETVTDNLTGLVWTKDANLLNTVNGGFNWQQSLDYVKGLNTQKFLGYNDWRLPNIIELESLVNKWQANPASWLNEQGFTEVQGGYVSSTTWGEITSGVWVGSMDGRYSNTTGKGTNVIFFWPVRGGQ